MQNSSFIINRKYYVIESNHAEHVVFLQRDNV